MYPHYGYYEGLNRNPQSALYFMRQVRVRVWAQTHDRDGLSLACRTHHEGNPYTLFQVEQLKLQAMLRQSTSKGHGQSIARQRSEKSRVLNDEGSYETDTVRYLESYLRPFKRKWNHAW